MSSGETYTCRKCQAEFKSRSAAAEHYGGKWHQFNLMRILKDLSPITEEVYNKSVAHSAFLAKGKNQTNAIPCRACKKSFNSQGSFETHQRSKKHKQNLVKKAAENVRRVQIQREKDAHKAQLLSYAMVVTSPDDDGVVKEGSYYCRPCKETFGAQKDYLKHAETDKHKNALKLLKITEDRKKELDEQDKEDAAAATASNMEVDDDDSDGWEDMEDGGESTMEFGEDGKRVPTVNTCLLCGKRAKKLQDNLQHMERHHQFKIPHADAADFDRLMPFLVQKIFVDHKCLECHKSFHNLKNVRRHMLDKPHLSMLFEGEYDEFFDIKKIMAPLALPFRPADDDIFALPLPDGTVLTHRELRRYFKQSLAQNPTVRNVKRLTSGRNAISHLGKFSKSNSEANFLSVRKDAQKRARVLKEETRGRARERLQVGIKANKLQPHIRKQVINAG
ncbi:Zinc finger C2H2-type [Trinorchestia longiramus]|nr:Zinc finger C2H2-type [Trinorchestia longiramus]